MPDARSLRERIVGGEDFNEVRIPMDSIAEQVQEIIRSQSADLIYVDSQHGPHTEWDIVRICRAAEELGVGVILRIKHTRYAHLIGNYLDLGLLGIKVPEVEDPAVVQEAINAFYYPPIGRRSWGGEVGFGKRSIEDRVEYATWWNKTGILAIKIESLKAVLNVRTLVSPLLTFMDYGGMDLRFSLETTPHPELRSFEDCKEFVKKELTDIDIRIL
ncbi:MAG: aldolase/citrate lyase family protein [Dehalococcoidia bacterium]|nr:aldolase/citrate lyase family protein [Dehalococcoidia bacterium]